MVTLTVVVGLPPTSQHRPTIREEEERKKKKAGIPAINISRELLEELTSINK